MSTYATKNGYVLHDVDGLMFHGLDRIVSVAKLRELVLKDRAALATPSPQPAHSDDLAVDRFAVAMKAKLADARAKGKGGWYDETACSQQYLSDELRRHALKPDPLDVANFAMFLHQRNEEIALPSPQPTDAVREALETARDYISDAATGTLTYKGSGEGFKAMAAEDLASLEAALAALASDPAPAGEAVEPVAMRNGVSAANNIAFWFFKDLTAGQRKNLFRVFGLPLEEIRSENDERRCLKSILSDPEDTARLREDLERESKESYEIGKRDGYEEAVQHIDERTGGDGEYCCVVGYDADDKHCPDPQSMIARIVGRFEALSEQTNVANRERDDARKALETARAETSAMHRRAQEEEYLRALIIGHCESWLEYYGRTKDRNRLTLMAIMRVARNRKRFIRALEEFATRSASREGASDE